MYGMSGSGKTPKWEQTPQQIAYAAAEAAQKEKDRIQLIADRARWAKEDEKRSDVEKSRDIMENFSRSLYPKIKEAEKDYKSYSLGEKFKRDYPTLNDYLKKKAGDNYASYYADNAWNIQHGKEPKDSFLTRKDFDNLFIGDKDTKLIPSSSSPAAPSSSPPVQSSSYINSLPQPPAAPTQNAAQIEYHARKSKEWNDKLLASMLAKGEHNLIAAAEGKWIGTPPTMAAFQPTPWGNPRSTPTAAHASALDVPRKKEFDINHAKQIEKIKEAIQDRYIKENKPVVSQENTPVINTQRPRNYENNNFFKNRPLSPYYSQRNKIASPGFINKQQRLNLFQNEPIEENPETSYTQQPVYYDEGPGRIMPAYTNVVNGRLNVLPPIENSPQTPYNERPQYFDEGQAFAHGGAVMNPAMMQMAIQQPPQQQQQPVEQQPNNPIMSGANAGMQAARNSMRMGDDDRQRALGFALMHFGRSMGNPALGGEGGNGQFGRIAQSIGPGTDAYMDYEKNAINHNILAQQMEDRRLQEINREKLHRDEMAMRDSLERDKLAEMKRYHSGLMDKSERLTKDERMYNLGQKKSEELQAEYPGAVAFETMNPAAQRQVSQELRVLGGKGKEYSKMLHNLNELKEIINKYPNLSDTATAAWYPEGEGFIKSRLRAGMPKDERFALERSNKLIKDILANKIQSVSSKTSTDIFKRILGDTLPSTRKNMDKANKAVINDLINEFKPMHDYIKMTPKMLSKGFYVPMPVPEVEDYVNYDIEKNVPVDNRQSNNNYGGLSEQEQQELDMLNGQLGYK